MISWSNELTALKINPIFKK